MTPQDVQTYLALQQRINESLSRIAIALEQMIPQAAAPNYQFTLKDFATFDFSSIGAKAIAFDDSGATALAWKNNTYLRRSPSNKFEDAIWFSRCVGKDEKGANQYERLVTFKAMSEAEPLPPRVASSFQSRR